jgi:hypothetical protein
MYVMDLLSGLGYALDTPGALTRGLLTGRPGERASGEDLLRALGIEDAGWLANTATEMAVDPMNLIGGLGVAKKLLGASKVRTANKASEALRASGAMPEEIARLTQLREQPRINFKYNTSDIESIVDQGPKRVAHGTSAQGFGPREFLPDPGSNNWMGKGTYFTDPNVPQLGGYSKATGKTATIQSRQHRRASAIPNAAAAIVDDEFKLVAQGEKSIESAADRIRQILGSADIEPTADLRKSLIKVASGEWDADTGRMAIMRHSTPPPEPRIMEAYIDTRKPFRFGDPADRSVLQKILGAPPQVPPVPDTSTAINDMLQALGKPPVRMKESLENIPEYVRAKGGLDKWSQGDVWQLARRRGFTPDELTDVLRAQGYDSLVHGAHTPRWKGYTKIDSHPEYVAFDPSQIYGPSIAPALRKPPNANPLIAALLGYNVANQSLPQ